VILLERIGRLNTRQADRFMAQAHGSMNDVIVTAAKVIRPVKKVTEVKLVIEYS